MSSSGEMRELTVRGVILGALLSALLSGANAYLGLFAGMTVSASIPAAVISMGLLKVFGGTILENNQVQTAASAGESAAAGAIFTLPALILLGAWTEFDLMTTGLLIGLGGILGVLFTTLLRRSLVVPDELPFPEGAATAEVLQAGHSDDESDGALGVLIKGASFGAVAKFIQSGLGWAKGTVEGATLVSGKVFYGGFGVSPALAAVGYIVGWEVALVVFMGGTINWLLVLPFVAEPDSTKSALDVAWGTWSEKTRYLGVGAMTVGALFQMRTAVKKSVSAGLANLTRGGTPAAKCARTDRDLPAAFIFSVLGLSLIPLSLLFAHLTGEWFISMLLAALVLAFGFLFSSVAAYMAGLVGSSNNPVSGVTIATILFTSFLISSWGIHAVGPMLADAAGPAAAILVGSVVCTAAAIGGDNVQDLRAGQILGATPYRQQIMQLIGVVVAALVLGPTLQLLMDGYGFGAPTEEHPNALRAPQATLMASVAKGVFGGDLPWNFFFTGVGLGIVGLVIDAVLRAKKTRFQFPILAFALGLYLPWELSVPVLLGGLVAQFSAKSAEVKRIGVLGAAGLITGEALMGIVLAAWVAIHGDLAALQSLGGPGFPRSLSVVILVSSLVLLARSRAARSR